MDVSGGDEGERADGVSTPGRLCHLFPPNESAPCCRKLHAKLFVDATVEILLDSKTVWQIKQP